LDAREVALKRIFRRVIRSLRDDWGTDFLGRRA
jgi:hypothetical protein